MENKKFRLYEMLSFLWKKKGWLIGLPVIAAVLAAGLSVATARGVEGSATFYTADPKLGELKDDELIDPALRDAVKVDTDVSVIGNSKIKLTIHGTDKKKVKEDLEKVTAEFERRLKKNYEGRKAITENTIAFSKERKEAVSDTEKVMRERLLARAESMTDEAFSDLSLAIALDQELIEIYDTTIKNNKTNLTFLEKPKVINGPEVKKEDNNMAANAIIAFFFTFFATTLALMLAKYIRDAKREISYD